MRDVSRSRGFDLKNVRVIGDPQAVIADPAVAIVVEAMGGTDPATALIESSLRAGKTVVTANKAVIATSGPRLCTLAAEHGAHLYFEASVGAGLPIIALLRGSLLGDRISALDGVINGTTNVILTQMRSAGVSYRECPCRRDKSRFCRGGSITRRRRLGRGPQAGDPRVARVRPPRLT